MGLTPEERKKYISDLEDSIKKEREAEKEKKRREEQARSEARSQEVETRRQEAEHYLKKRPWIAWIILFVIIAASCWFVLDRVFPGPTQTPQIPQSQIIEISASQLYQEYLNNEVAADLQYEGKRLQVTGIVHTVGEDILGDLYIVIVGDEDDVWGVQCSYPNTQAYRQALAKFNKGQTVRVTGICKGYLINVLLEAGQ